METTNPAAEVASPEERLEALFSGKQPAAPEAKPEADPEPEQEDEAQEEAEESEAEAVEDQAEAPEESAEPDAVEVEFEGKTYAVPKELAPHLLRQKDYTQKTQEVAARRKEVEERAAFLDQMEQVRSAVFEKATELRSVEAQLKRFEAVDWNALIESDLTQYHKLDRTYKELQAQQASIAGEVQELATKQQTLTAEQRQQAKARGNEILSRDIKGWGPELGRKIMDNAKSYGFEDVELADVLDPRYVKVLHDAYQWRQLQAAKPDLKKKVAEVKPVTVKSARTTQTTQVAQANDADRQRLKKTGDPRAAEALLARRLEMQSRRR